MNLRRATLLTEFLTHSLWSSCWYKQQIPFHRRLCTLGFDMWRRVLSLSSDIGTSCHQSSWFCWHIDSQIIRGFSAWTTSDCLGRAGSTLWVRFCRFALSPISSMADRALLDQAKSKVIVRFDFKLVLFILIQGYQFKVISDIYLW